MNGLGSNDMFIQKMKQLNYSVLQINGIDVIAPPLVAIPPGDFLMGSDPSRDREAADDELPVHRVRTAAYQISRFPVTVGEYACFVRAGGSPPETRQDVSWELQQLHLDHPVVCVRWIDAMD